MKKFKEGDIVALRAVVTAVLDPSPYNAEAKLKLSPVSEKSPNIGYFYAPQADAELLVPVFDVGETVRDPAGDLVKILAIVGEKAWVCEGDAGLDRVERLHFLSRVEPDVIPEGWQVIEGGAEPDPLPEEIATAMDLNTWETAEGTTTVNADGSLTHDIGPFKPVASDAPVAASVLDKIAADPNVNHAFQTAIKE